MPQRDILRPPTDPATATTSESQQAVPELELQSASAGVFSPVTIARLRTRWSRVPLLSLTGLGMLLAVVLICLVPLFTSLISTIQIEYAVNSAAATDRNVEIQVKVPQYDASILARVASDEQAVAQRSLSRFVQPQATTYLSSGKGPLLKIGTQSNKPAFAPHFHLLALNISRVAPHMHLLAGNLPSAAAHGAPYPVLITPQMAQDDHLGVGTTVTVGDFGYSGVAVPLQVVGIWEPRDAQDPFWNGLSFDSGANLKGNAVGKQDYTANYPLLLPQADFAPVTTQMPFFTVTQHWIYYTDPQRLDAQHLGQDLAGIQHLRATLSANVNAESTVIQT